jgi:PLP dependent protein
MEIRANLEKIKKEIPGSVTLVAVSKKKPAEAIMEAYEAGHRDFGENYVQELTAKQPLLPADVRWHFIGHLQSNKVKYIAPFVHLIHGVDSFKLLEEIDRQGKKHRRTIDCLLQLHIATEETKYGLSIEECRELLLWERVGELRHARVRGFMAMASNTEDMDQVKREFRTVKEFRDAMAPRVPGLDILSYGMSGDYRLAIEEGSTMVRVGSLIFGEREH